MIVPYSTSGVILGLLVSLCLYFLIRPWTSPLRKVPGPWLTRYSRLWLLNETYYSTFPKTNVKLHKKYGRVVRIAPNEYSIDDPDAAKIIYGSGRGFIKSRWYEASGDPNSRVSGIFHERDPHVHSAFRRKIAAVYSMTSLVQLEPFVDQCTEVYQRRLEEFADSGAPVDMAHWMQCYAFDVIGKITTGDRLGFLDDGKDPQGVMESITSFLTYAVNVGVYPEWHRLLFQFRKRFLTTNGLLAVREFSGTRLQARYAKPLPDDDDPSSTAPADFIKKFQRMQKQDPNKISHDEVNSICSLNIGAGSDTTSISLAATLYFLLRRPNTMKALKDEIRDFDNRALLSDPVRFSQAQQMPYLQAVIKESLRVHPAAGLILGRIVPEGGATLAGQYFPAGTTVGINAWVAHANQDVFGRDADTFRPERWLESPEVVKKRDAYFMTFGQGARTCIGKNISHMEMSKCIPQVLRHFDFIPATASGEPDWQTEYVWFVKPREFFCHVRRREQKATS